MTMLHEVRKKKKRNYEHYCLDNASANYLFNDKYFDVEEQFSYPFHLDSEYVQ